MAFFPGWAPCIVFATKLSHMREHGYLSNSRCDMMETHVIIDSPEPEENIKDLLNKRKMAVWRILP